MSYSTRTRKIKTKAEKKVVSQPKKKKKKTVARNPQSYLQSEEADYEVGVSILTP